MFWPESPFDVRAEHPKRIHVDRQMKETRVKKTAGDQLPHPESDGVVELGYNKMANRPKREVREQSWTRYHLKQENGDIDSDQYSCESRHKNSLTRSDHFHTKDHDGYNKIFVNTKTLRWRREKNKPS